MHHKLAFSLGGTSDLSNLEALCKECHAVQTERLSETGAQYSGYASQLSPRMSEMFLRTPKPKQWHRGGGCPEHVDCLDVVRCRCNGLMHAGQLPVFDPEEVAEADVADRAARRARRLLGISAVAGRPFSGVPAGPPA